MSAFALPGDLTESEFERAVSTLIGLTTTSSASNDLRGLEAMCAGLAGEFEARGLPARIDRAPTGDRRELPVFEAGRSGGGALLLIGHLDTVLPAATPRREGSRLFATGAIDMKGGVATLLAALDRLRARGVAAPRDLQVVLVPDEEVAGEISRRLTAERGATARAVWVLEPGEPGEDGAETIVMGRRGMATFRLDVTGRAAHSGLHFAQGRSASVAAAEWAVAAGALSGPGDGPTLNIARIVAGDRGFVEALDRAASLLGSETQLNVVPDRAVVDGEFRFLRGAERTSLAIALEAHARRIASLRGVEIDLRLRGDVPPVEATASRAALADRAIERAAARGWRLVAERDRGGISFPNFLPADAEIPVLDGLGPIGSGMHTRDESVDLRSFARRIVLLADLLELEATAS